MYRSSSIAIIVSAVALLAAGCKDTSPPTWTQGARLAVERAEGASQVEVSWPAATDNEGVVGYKLSVDNDPPEELPKDATKHTIEDLKDAADHEIHVQAGDENGNWSTFLSAKLTIPDLTPPTWPVERFEVEPLEPSDEGKSYKFSWEPAADNVGVTAYLLTRTGSDFKVKLGPEVREHAIQGEDIEGRYELKAMDAAGKQSEPLACTVRSRRLLDRKLATNAGILGLMKADRGDYSNVFGSGGLRGALPGRPDGAFGGLTGSAIDDSRGFGGLGLKGTGSGGGDSGIGLGGLGGLGRRGTGSGGGYGSGRLGRPQEKVPGSVAPSVANTTGSINASAARRAITSQTGAFKACYEKRLKNDPEIQGSLELTITLANGKVKKAEVTGDSLEDSGTRSCVRRVARRLRVVEANGTVVVRLVFQKS